MALLNVTGLKTYFPIRTGILRRHTDDVRAVDDVSFSVEKGTTVGLVGESGSGKSTIGKTLLRLVPATAGIIHFDGRDITNMPESDFRPFRKRMQMIFQDPFGSLNPRHTIRQIVSEALEIHFPTLSTKDRSDKVASLLEKVGLKPEMATDWNRPCTCRRTRFHRVRRTCQRS
jgi:oligopeptide transport system ATP-binding protein